MKVGLIIVTHQSGIRPTGHAALKRCIDSIKTHVKFDYDIIVIDNGSDVMYPNTELVDFLYRPKQLNGLIGAWNDGVSISHEMEHDLHVLISDDVYFNETINTYPEVIKNHEYNDRSIYGVLTDSKTAFPSQITSGLKETGLRDVTGAKFPIHGWLFGFTKKFYSLYNVDGLMFDNTHLFGESETHFQRQIWGTGGKSFIVLDCLAHHEHIGAWRKLENNGSHLKTKG